MFVFNCFSHLEFIIFCLVWKVCVSFQLYYSSNFLHAAIFLQSYDINVWLDVFKTQHCVNLEIYKCLWSINIFSSKEKLSPMDSILRSLTIQWHHKLPQKWIWRCPDDLNENTLEFKLLFSQDSNLVKVSLILPRSLITWQILARNFLN